MNEYFFANCLDNSYNKNVNYILFKEMILLDIYQESLKYHENLKGKYEIKSRATINNAQDLSLAYTPGVAEPCREIHKDPSKAYLYTRKWNTVAVISDGTAVLGLGDIGPLASLPVMEGKSILFKEFAHRVGGFDWIWL